MSLNDDNDRTKNRLISRPPRFLPLLDPAKVSFRVARGVVPLLILGFMAADACAQIQIEQQLEINGVVESASGTLITARDAEGTSYAIRVPDKTKGGIPLASGGVLKNPATLTVTGFQEVASLVPGDQLRFELQLKPSGQSTGTAQNIQNVSGKKQPNQITVQSKGATTADFDTCIVIGQFQKGSRNRIVLSVPKDNGYVNRKLTLSVQVDPDDLIAFETDDPGRITAGARISGSALKLSTGDIVAKDLKVECDLQKKANPADKQAAKYHHLSDEPKKAPRLLRSQHFALKTDVSDRQGKIILDQLEEMVVVLNRYFGRTMSGVIEGFVVHDLKVWPPDAIQDPMGLQKIKDGAGVCMARNLGKLRHAVLYSCNRLGTIRHECAHGYCHITFGSPGPTWLAEGVAELAKYWKPNDPSVSANPLVLAYIRDANPPKGLTEIAVPGQVPAGNWQDYSWRWALCHLLSSNPNYAPRFKPLAIALMEGRDQVSFESVYGPVAPQISFEYDLFLRTVDTGYRADLCAWDWKTPSRPLSAGGQRRTKVKARGGWQASGLLVSKGTEYKVSASGAWKIAKDGAQYDADGDKTGRGRLVAVIFEDYKLSEPIELGKDMSFVAPVGGQLVLRCSDPWGGLDDNDGELTVVISR